MVVLPSDLSQAHCAQEPGEVRAHAKLTRIMGTVCCSEYLEEIHGARIIHISDISHS